MPTRQAAGTRLVPAMHSRTNLSLVPVKFRSSKLMFLVVRSYRSDGQQDIPSHAEQVQQSYQRKMQELLQKQREVAREQQVAARGSGKGTATGQPVANSSSVPAIAAPLPSLAESSLPPLTPTGSTTSSYVPPAQQVTAQTARHDHLPLLQHTLHSPAVPLPKPGSQLDIARDVGHGFTQQRQHSPNSTAMQSLRSQDQKEPPGRRAWPDLLPSVRHTKKSKDKAKDSVGLDLLPSSERSEFYGSGGGNGTIVGSTRRAKSAFGTASDPGHGRQFGYKSSVTCSNGFSDDWGNGPSTAGLPWHQPPDAAGKVAGQPPMAQRTMLSLNPNIQFGSQTAAAQQNFTNAASVPGSAGAAPTAPGGSRGSVGNAVTKGNAATAGDVTAAAVAASDPAAANVPVAAVKKKPARPAALWLSSFVQAAGRAGGTSAGATAVTPTAVVATAKQPVPDAGVTAAAMVRAAAERPAVELAESMSDLPATIQQLQARLEAAVHAEQESELRALRALYASGSLRQLQREGIVLVGLAAVETGQMYRSTLWRFSLIQKKGASTAAAPSLPYHKLRPGTSAIITAHIICGDREGATATAMVDAETGLPDGGVEGVVVEVHKDHVVVALEGRSHEIFQAMVTEVRSAPTSNRTSSGHGAAAVVEEAVAGPFGGWRLDQSVRDTTARRHLEGIRRLGTWAEPSAEDRLGEARVRAILAGSRSAALLAAEAPEWVKEDRWREDARTALAAQQGLNDSQRRAVAAALTRAVTLWQGPPGTGKTRTLLALIEILVRVRSAGLGPVTRVPRGSSRASASVATSPRAAAMGPVLAVADTNAAVDNLVDGLSARGVKTVRLGPASKARDSLRHLSLEAQAEATPLGRKAVALRTQALRKQELWRQAQWASRPGLDAPITAAAAAQAAEVRTDLERAEAVLREASAEVVASADVVVSTCTAAGDFMLDGRPWRCVVVDEASQATEPSVLVALTRGAAFVVMAGDPRQLPPTVMSEAALQHGLNVTLFERVAGAGGIVPLLLDTQYRMHPAISAFPSAFFYGGRLRDGVAAADKPVPRGFPWPNPSKPLALVQVTGGREETSGGLAELAASLANANSTHNSGRGKGSGGGALLAPKGGVDGKPEAPPSQKSSEKASYRNPAEARLALAVTQRLLAAGDVTSAAILTPYKGQLQLIEALSRQRGLEAAWSAAGLEVAISTVDGYQGREADVVVFSAVRANDQGTVGFLSDPRRMNVAITRPRRGLVVLADTETLIRGSKDWGMYFKWARAYGVVVSDADVMDIEDASSNVEGALSDGDSSDIASRPTGSHRGSTGASASSTNLRAAKVVSVGGTSLKRIASCKTAAVSADVSPSATEKVAKSKRGERKKGNTATTAAVMELSELADGQQGAVLQTTAGRQRWIKTAA